MYLKKEVSMCSVIGPLSDKPSGVQINKFGVIPKSHQPREWIIVGLSSPEKPVSMMVLVKNCVR